VGKWIDKKQKEGTFLLRQQILLTILFSHYYTYREIAHYLLMLSVNFPCALEVSETDSAEAVWISQGNKEDKITLISPIFTHTAWELEVALVALG
jgi:hypothetical protein